jgi:hypothetical protein
VEDRAAREQRRSGGHERHATVMIHPAARQRFDREGDQAGHANEQSDVRLLPAKMLDEKRKSRKEEKEAEKISQCNETQKDKISCEKWRKVLVRHRPLHGIHYQQRCASEKFMGAS